MKRFIAITLALLFALALVGCADKTPPNDGPAPTAAPVENDDEETVQTAIPTAAPTEEAAGSSADALFAAVCEFAGNGDMKALEGLFDPNACAALDLYSFGILGNDVPFEQAKAMGAALVAGSNEFGMQFPTYAALILSKTGCSSIDQYREQHVAPMLDGTRFRELLKGFAPAASFDPSSVSLSSFGLSEAPIGEAGGRSISMQYEEAGGVCKLVASG
ncbi:MAG: hypothetical protein J6P98_00630 [Clostridia bacterium]|nr:hypothetical protein [Clostridia bacterium]